MLVQESLRKVSLPLGNWSNLVKGRHVAADGGGVSQEAGNSRASCAVSG